MKRSDKIIQLNLGIQPLDKLMNENGWSNNFLVEKSSNFLTHKQVRKARKGRRLTANIQLKLLDVVNICCKPKVLKINDLFTYFGNKNLKD
tara:strand:- start:699 stop:971 length:273 start_codon:yes stop_codon:yes gene_type:complete